MTSSPSRCGRPTTSPSLTRYEVSGFTASISVGRCFARRPLGVARVEREFAALYRSFRPDVVHSHDVGPLALMHVRRVSAPVVSLVVTAHTLVSPSLGVVPVDAVRRVLQSATWVTGVSQAVLDDLVVIEPSLQPRSSVVHSGVPPLTTAPPREVPSAPTIAFVGRLAREKGVDVLLGAFAQLTARDGWLRLVLAGDGPEAPELRHLADTLGVAPQVDFLGALDRAQLAEVIDRATVVAIPSRREGFPLVALEAAQRARPVVATTVGGLPEIVVDGRTGLLVVPDDVDALARALGDLLGDRDRAAEMGGAAREVAAVDFSFEACVDGYERVLLDAVHASDHGAP